MVSVIRCSQVLLLTFFTLFALVCVYAEDDVNVLVGDPTSTYINGPHAEATFGFGLTFPIAYRQPHFTLATGLALDDNGDLLVADTHNSLIRKVELSSNVGPSKRATPQVTTLFGREGETVFRNLLMYAGFVDRYGSDMKRSITPEESDFIQSSYERVQAADAAAPGAAKRSTPLFSDEELAQLQAIVAKMVQAPSEKPATVRSPKPPTESAPVNKISEKRSDRKRGEKPTAEEVAARAEFYREKAAQNRASKANANTDANTNANTEPAPSGEKATRIPFPIYQPDFDTPILPGQIVIDNLGFTLFIDPTVGIWIIPPDNSDPFYGFFDDTSYTALAFDPISEYLYIGTAYGIVLQFDTIYGDDVEVFKDIDTMVSRPLGWKDQWVFDLKIEGDYLYAAVKESYMDTFQSTGFDYQAESDAFTYLVRMDLDEVDPDVGFWSDNVHMSAFEIVNNKIYYAVYGTGQIKKATVSENGPTGLTFTEIETIGSANEFGIVDGSGNTARFMYVTGMLLDKDGTGIYVIDGHALRHLVCTQSLTVTTITGSKNPWYQDGVGTNARLSMGLSASYGAPSNPLATGPDGKIYVAEHYFSKIRSVDTKTKTVSTVFSSKSMYPNWMQHAQVINPDGIVKRSEHSKRTITLTNDKMFGPTSIAVHPVSGDIYFADTAMYLKRIKKGASTVETLVNKPHDSIGGIAIHPDLPNKVFYADVFDAIFAYDISAKTTEMVAGDYYDRNMYSEMGMVTLVAAGNFANGNPRFFVNNYNFEQIFTFNPVTGDVDQVLDGDFTYIRSFAYSKEANELYVLDVEGYYGSVKRVTMCNDAYSVSDLAGYLPYDQFIKGPLKRNAGSVPDWVSSLSTVGPSTLVMLATLFVAARRRRMTTRMDSWDGCCMPNQAACGTSCISSGNSDVALMFLLLASVGMVPFALNSIGGSLDEAQFVTPIGLATNAGGIYVATGDNVIIHVPYPVANLTSISGPVPTSGGPVTIAGAGFSSVQDVTIGGVNCDIDSQFSSDTKIVCDLGAGAGRDLLVDVSLASGGGACGAGGGVGLTTNYSYLPPIVTAADPPQTSIFGGTRVTITGENLGPDVTYIRKVTITGLECTQVLMPTPHTTITCLTPHGVGSLNPVIVYGAQPGKPATQIPSNGDILLGYPKAVAMAPAGGSSVYFVRSTKGEGQITIFGNFFPDSPFMAPGSSATPAQANKRSISKRAVDDVYTGSIRVFIGGRLATIVSSNQTTIVVQVPPGFGVNQIVELDINEPQSGWILVPELFVTYAAPVVTYAHPAENVKAGTVVTIFGSNFGPAGGNYGFAKIGNTICQLTTVLSNEQITCVVKSGSGANQLVSVTLAGQTSTEVVTVDFAVAQTAGLTCVPPFGAQDINSPEYCNCFSGYAPANPAPITTECNTRAVCPGKLHSTTSISVNRPERPIVSFRDDTLFVRQTSSIVDKRRDTTIQFVVPALAGNTDAGALSETTCWYPGPIWTKTVDDLDCNDVYVGQMPWTQHGMCGWVEDTAASTVSRLVYKSLLVTTTRDAYKRHDGSLGYKSTKTSYLVSVKFERQIQVITKATVNVIIEDPEISVAVEGSIVYDVAEQKTLLTIVTTVNWPYMINPDTVLAGVHTSSLVPPATGVVTTGTFQVPQPGNAICDDTAESTCDQYWNVVIDNNDVCNLQGKIDFNTTVLLCRDVEDSSCPSAIFKNFILAISSTDLCNPNDATDATANLETALTPYYDSTLTQEQNVFQVGDWVYFKFHLVDPQGTIDQATFSLIQLIAGSEDEEIYKVANAGDWPADPATTKMSDIIIINEQRLANNTPVAPGQSIDLTFGFRFKRDELSSLLQFDSAGSAVSITIHATIDIWYHGNQKRTLALTGSTASAAANDVISIIPIYNEAELAMNEEAIETEVEESPFEFSLFSEAPASPVSMAMAVCFLVFSLVIIL